MGTIWKKWPGFNDEHNMDHEYFGLEGELYTSAKGSKAHTSKCDKY